jgi:hypothetical protein
MCLPIGSEIDEFRSSDPKLLFNRRLVDLFHDDLRMRRARSKPFSLGISKSKKIPSNFS